MDFKDLKALSQIGYEREQQTLKKLLVEENLVRADLNRLAQNESSARSVAFVDATAPRSLGADVLWLEWVSKSRGVLNRNLARILAQKEQHLAKVRHAYGKVLVSEALSERDLQERSKRFRQKHLQGAADQALNKKD